MVVAMARDPRVLVIKLSDRLHNMRTMRFLKPEKQAKKARETLEVLAPLAHRLGMSTVKWELEDLAFAILHPKRYDEIVRLVADRAPSRDTYLRTVIDEVSGQLEAARVKAEVLGRPKHYYSIYQKMIVKGKDFDDIHDLVGVRILVEDVRDCYAAMGMVHALWQPMPGRFKDYIAQPRFGVYQSLHTTVIGPDGQPLEVQIRTHEMHRTAEYGIAAHWRYKETKGVARQRAAVELDEMAWMRQLLDWQREAADPGEFLESLRYDLATREIFVFTPKGDVITLPHGSTPVDFAYAVHTEVGNKCIGVAGQRPARRAGAPARERRGRRDLHLEGRGRRAVARLAGLRRPRRGPSRRSSSGSPRSAARRRSRAARTRSPARRGAPGCRCSGWSRPTRWARWPASCATRTSRRSTRRSASTTSAPATSCSAWSPCSAGWSRTRRSSPTAPRRRPSSGAGATGDVGVVVNGVDGGTRDDSADLWIKLARCCTPVPGDEILGFVTRGGGVSVHRTDCTNADDLRAEPERLVDVSWASSSTAVFLVAIQVEALDRHRLLSDITKVLADEKVNILSASVTTSPRPRGRQPVQLRDGRPEAPRARAARGAQRRGRLRRVPGDLRDLSPDGRAQETVTVWISIGVFGLPSPVPLLSSVPAAATLSIVASPPSSIVPKTV